MDILYIDCIDKIKQPTTWQERGLLYPPNKGEYMNCKSCPYFKQSPNFPQWGNCTLLGGDGVKSTHPQCDLHKRIAKID